MIVAGLGAVLAVGLVAAANGLIYGHAVGPQVDANFAGARLQRSFVVLRLIAGKNVARIWVIPAFLALLLGFLPGRIVQAIRMVLATSLAAGLIPILLTQTLPPGCYRSFTGVLETSPFFFLLPAIRLKKGRVGEAASVLGVAAAVSALGIAMTAPVEGGPQGGSRFLLPSIALGLAAVLSALAVPGTPGALQRWHRRILLGMLSISIPLSTRALPDLVHHLRHVQLPALEAVRGMPGEAVIFTDSVPSQEMASGFDRRPFFLASNPTAAAPLLTTLAAVGVRQLVWVDQAGLGAPQSLAGTPPNHGRGEGGRAGPLPMIWNRTALERTLFYQIASYTMQ